MLRFMQTTVQFGDTRALNALSFDFVPGHVYGLVGPNGCGKSTLMKVAAGLVRSDSGSVLYYGQPVKTDMKRYIAYLPTHPVYYHFMSITDLGTFYQDFFEDFDAQKYQWLIQYFRLNPKQKIHTLSTGMAAKTKLAATLSRNAGLILLDEPMNGIDLIGQDQVRNLLQELRNPDRTIIVSSHMFEHLETIADTAVMMTEGRILMHGDLQQLREQYHCSVSDLYRQMYMQQVLQKGGYGL